MRYIFISLLFGCLTVKAQQTEAIGKTELQHFIWGKHLVKQGKKVFRMPKKAAVDSMVSLTCDSVVFRLSIPELASLKTKDVRTAVKYSNGLEDLRQLYVEGIDTLQLEDAKANTEKLLADAIRKGKVEQILVRDQNMTNYTCESYGFSKKGRAALFALYDKQGRLLLSYTYVICFGIKFR